MKQLFKMPVQTISVSIGGDYMSISSTYTISRSFGVVFFNANNGLVDIIFKMNHVLLP